MTGTPARQAQDVGAVKAGERPTVSVVVPIWRLDRAELAGLIAHLRVAADTELIIVPPWDEVGGYAALGADQSGVRVVFGPRGRASQMNAGAAVADGQWVVFLHADSRLPLGWRTAIDRAAREPRVVWGSYRLALDSPDWRARLVECGVRMRVWLGGLPYGDQALFVRRDTFQAIGGYRDLPLMEDVDLVGRLKQAGASLHSRLPVTTSARRWERDGWFWRSLQNVSIAVGFFGGVRPNRLAQRYLGRRPMAVAVMTRAVWLQGRRGMASPGADSGQARVGLARLRDTLGSLECLADTDRVVVCDPPEACEALRLDLGPHVEVIAQRPGSLGQRIQGAFTDVFRLGTSAVILIGPDAPDLPPSLIEAAVQALRARGDRLLLGLSAEGGYVLAGLKCPHGDVFSAIDWGGHGALVQLLDGARAKGVSVQLVELPALR